MSLLLCGCPLSHGDYPSTACEQNSDCFPNESCTAGECVARGTVDAAIDRAIVDAPADAPIDGPDMPDGGM